MSIFETAVGSLLAAIDDAHSNAENINDLARCVSAHRAGAPADALNKALHALALRLPDVPLGSLGALALTCGTLVEQGGDPEIAGAALLATLVHANAGEIDFCVRCRALAESDTGLLAVLRPLAADNMDDDCDASSLSAAEIIDDHISNEGWENLVERFGPALLKVAPDSVLLHNASEHVRLSLIAHLSRSKKLRALARAQVQHLEQTQVADNAAREEPSFLLRMLQVLDDAPLLVLHVAQKKGFALRISGIADNFQLHTLLAGALIGSPAQARVTGEAPSELAVAQCRDAAVGANNAELVTGAFNLWHWHGIQADGCLPDGQDRSQHWIWNEGIPAAIVPFEAQRIVLLGPAPYQRSWRAGRSFPGMVAELTIERQLSDDEVTDWLRRLAQAAHPTASGASLAAASATGTKPSARSWWKFLLGHG